ncbi:MAG TPA: hypothetical protein V6D28_30590 [Leptolyngbyaceae cyanobacterium]
MHVHGEYNASLPSVIFENQQAANNQESEELAVKSPKEITIVYCCLLRIGFDESSLLESLF